MERYVIRFHKHKCFYQFFFPPKNYVAMLGIQQIYVQNILNMLHTLRFFLFKMPFIS